MNDYIWGGCRRAAFIWPLLRSYIAKWVESRHLLAGLKHRDNQKLLLTRRPRAAKLASTGVADAGNGAGRGRIYRPSYYV